jgi:cyclopropane fatty-acyl-phospholipid synthase-like methyltransferase
MTHKELSTSAEDIATFYSMDDLTDWQAVLGPGMHYHFGAFRGNEDMATGLRAAVQRLFMHIPFGARVLDLGCGWGGPAAMLQDEHGCRVTGVTVSRTQSEYCRARGLHTLQLDMTRDELPTDFDVVLLMESLEHVTDRVDFLRRLHDCAPRLVFQVNCAHPTADGAEFDGTMRTFTPSQLQDEFRAAGWNPTVWEEVRFASLRTAALWEDNLRRRFGDAPPGHFAVLYDMLRAIRRDPLRWALANPLIAGTATHTADLPGEKA